MPIRKNDQECGNLKSLFVYYVMPYYLSPHECFHRCHYHSHYYYWSTLLNQSPQNSTEQEQVDFCPTCSCTSWCRRRPNCRQAQPRVAPSCQLKFAVHHRHLWPSMQPLYSLVSTFSTFPHLTVSYAVTCQPFSSVWTYHRETLILVQTLPPTSCFLMGSALQLPL